MKPKEKKGGKKKKIQKYQPKIKYSKIGVICFIWFCGVFY
jgi:hypothetical protein